MTSRTQGIHAFMAADAADASLSGGANVAIRLTPNQQLVDRAYRTLLGRAAEFGGLVYWSGLLEQGLGRDQIARALVQSPEYFITNVIVPAYHDYLGRDPDAAGENYWVTRCTSRVRTHSQPYPPTSGSGTPTLAMRTSASPWPRRARPPSRSRTKTTHR